jgi:beta-N-acetylhexosaminidase
MKHLAIALCLLAFASPMSLHAKPSNPKDSLDKQLTQMTLDQKIGQLLMPSIKPDAMLEGELPVEIQTQIQNYGVGGFHLLIDGNKLQEPYKVALALSKMQKLSKTPLLIAADLEGGAGFYYKGLTRVPRAMAIGATNDKALAYAAARITALEAQRIGINVNFAPALDVNSNPYNPIINIRSFGSNPVKVSEMGVSYLQGLQKTGLMAVAKHFPGHGDTAIDSHLNLPTLDIDLKTMRNRELLPFVGAIKVGVNGVMVGHIALPQIDASGFPASLSGKVVNDILRRDLGFKGLIFTDALNMNSIAGTYSAGQAAVLAVKAGTDILVCLVDLRASFEAIQAAVKSGEIPEERLDDSVRRILKAKNELGLFENKDSDLANFWEHDFEDQNHKALASRIDEKALTLLNDTDKLLPLRAKSQNVLNITLLDKKTGWRESSPGETFYAGLKKQFPLATQASIDEATTEDQFKEIISNAAKADFVITNIFTKVAAYKGTVGLNKAQLAFLSQLSQSAKPQIFIFYGNPYLCSSFLNKHTVVLTYECTVGAEEAALKGILGQIPFVGKLPVKLPISN